MKTRPSILLITCWVLLLNGCLSEPEIRTALEEVPIDTASSTPVSIITNTPSPTPEKECWEPDWQMVWANGHELRAIGEGPQDVFWFLSDSSLDRMSIKNEIYKFIEFSGILHCDNCRDIVNGTLAISTSGEAWIGLSTGLLIVDKDGAWRQIDIDEVLPFADKSLGLRVLLSDANGNIWVSNSNSICYFNGTDWNCHQIDGLQEKITIAGVEHEKTAEIISAVSGQANQVWFGTKYGRVILFNGNDYDVYNLSELTDFNSYIGSLAFDEKTGTLWALNTSGGSKDTIGVFRRSSDGNWKTFRRDLFSSRPDQESFGQILKSIAVTHDGTVWLGMERGLALVYYNGVEWKTLDGESLPVKLSYYSKPKLPNIDGCNLPDDYIVDIFAAENGNLIVGNQIFGFMYKKAEK